MALVLVLCVPLVSGCALFSGCEVAPEDGPNPIYDARLAQIHHWRNEYDAAVEITLSTLQCGTLVATSQMRVEPGVDAGWSAPGPDERIITAVCGTRERGNATEVRIAITLPDGSALDDETDDGCGMASYYSVLITTRGKLELH